MSPDWLLTGDPGSVALLGAKVDFSLYLHCKPPELLVRLALLLTAALEEHELGHVLDAMDDVREVPSRHLERQTCHVPFPIGARRSPMGKQ